MYTVQNNILKRGMWRCKKFSLDFSFVLSLSFHLVASNCKYMKYAVLPDRCVSAYVHVNGVCGLRGFVSFMLMQLKLFFKNH